MVTVLLRMLSRGCELLLSTLGARTKVSPRLQLVQLLPVTVSINRGTDPSIQSDLPEVELTPNLMSYMLLTKSNTGISRIRFKFIALSLFRHLLFWALV